MFASVVGNLLRVLFLRQNSILARDVINVLSFRRMFLPRRCRDESNRVSGTGN
jgi:hypothetical protein